MNTTLLTPWSMPNRSMSFLLICMNLSVRCVCGAWNLMVLAELSSIGDWRGLILPVTGFLLITLRTWKSGRAVLVRSIDTNMRSESSSAGSNTSSAYFCRPPLPRPRGDIVMLWCSLQCLISCWWRWKASEQLGCSHLYILF